MEPNRRETDHSGIHIDRVIPMWGILCVLGAIAGQAVLIWASQREQAAVIVALTNQVQDANQSINRLTAEIGSKNIKDVEHDMKLADIERRMTLMESRK